MVKEMCRATYRAEQVGEAIVIFATGVHHQTGYAVSFERVGVTIFPPHFSFMHQASSGAVVNRLTPFSHHVTVEIDRKVDKIIIYDSGGRHEIEVEQLSTEAAQATRDE